MLEIYNKYLIPIVLGLITGSFLNVCIFRIPAGRSIATPGSSCPSCGRMIAWYDNIPILSYFILRGRCRYCGATISLQYPIVEGLTALLAFLLARLHPPLFTAPFWIFFAFVCSLLVITFIDLKHFIIPDVITYPGIPVGIIASWFLTDVGIRDSIIGAIGGFLFLLFVAEFYRLLTGREGMGGGDIKLAGMIGAFTGWQGILFTVFAGALVGSIIGSLYLLLKKKESSTPIPFGPFLSLGAIVYLFIGKAWLDLLVSIRYL